MNSYHTRGETRDVTRGKTRDVTRGETRDVDDYVNIFNISKPNFRLIL